MKKYVLDVAVKGDYTAGSKARKDIDAILTEQGFEKLILTIGDNKKKVLKEVNFIFFQLKTLMKNLQRDSFLLVQYPWPTTSFRFAKIIRSIAKERNIQTCALIHDLNSIRTGSTITKLYYLWYVREYSFLGCFDKIICHNGEMKKALVRRGVQSDRIISLDLFDYLVTGAAPVHGIDDQYDMNIISIAGNLSRDKTAYIYGLPDIPHDHFSFDLYGPNYTGDRSDYISYKGVVSSDELPCKISTGFGLVWDGDSCETCTGHFGEYMRINNPHKLSLYMACGIPVIVWKEAAVSTFVLENRVGITVSSLFEIDDVIQNMPEAEYSIMKQNAVEMSRRVTQGDNIKSALKKCGLGYL